MVNIGFSEEGHLVLWESILREMLSGSLPACPFPFNAIHWDFYILKLLKCFSGVKVALVFVPRPYVFSPSTNFCSTSSVFSFWSRQVSFSLKVMLFAYMSMLGPVASVMARKYLREKFVWDRTPWLMKEEQVLFWSRLPGVLRFQSQFLHGKPSYLPSVALRELSFVSIVSWMPVYKAHSTDE